MSKRVTLARHGGKPSSGTRTTSVRGAADALNTTTACSSLPRRVARDVRRPRAVRARVAASRCRDLRRRRSGRPCARARDRSSSRRSSRAPGCRAACATPARARAVRRRDRARARTPPTARPTPVSSVSTARLRNFSGIRADHTPGSRFVVRAPTSSPDHSTSVDASGSRAAASSSSTRSRADERGDVGRSTCRPAGGRSRSSAAPGRRPRRRCRSITDAQARDGGGEVAVGVEPAGREVALGQLPGAHRRCRRARARRYSGPSVSSSAPLPRQ